MTARYRRRPEYDQRIAYGDPQDADAWEDTSRTVIDDGWEAMTLLYTPMGVDPNR